MRKRNKTPASSVVGEDAPLSASSQMHNSNARPQPGAVVAGIICASVVAVALVGALLWLARKRLGRYYLAVRSRLGVRSASYVDNAKEGSPSSTCYSIAGVNTGKPQDPSAERETSLHYQHGLSPENRITGENTRKDLSPATTTEQQYIPDLGLSLPDLRRSDRAEKPDVVAATTVDKLAHPPSTTPWRAPRTPAIRVLDTDRPLPASPSVSSVPTPITPFTSNTTSSQPTASTLSATPYTPSVYHPEPPTSLPQSRGNALFVQQPAAGPTLPPSLPQPYSTVSLGSTAELYRRLNSSINLYRGLSTREGNNEQPPWAYLSAEEAMRGGWRNSTSKDRGQNGA